MQDWKELRQSLLADNSESILPPSIKLPILPKALTEFRSRAEDPNVDVDELVKIVSSDTGLSTELLRNVNVCMSGSLGKITSVKQAIVMAGIRSISLQLTTSCMNQMLRSSSSRLINFQNFWNTNLERALFARELAKLLRADAELAFTAAMLQDFLLPLITNQNLTEYLEFTENRDNYGSLVQFEQHKLGWNHAEAAAQLMFAWQFPDELICCVCLHHKGLGVLADAALGKTSVAAVAISSLIPDALRQESDGLDKLMALDANWSDFDLQATIKLVDNDFQSIAQNVRNHFSLQRAYKNKLSRVQSGA